MKKNMINSLLVLMLVFMFSTNMVVAAIEDGSRQDDLNENIVLSEESKEFLDENMISVEIDSSTKQTYNDNIMRFSIDKLSKYDKISLDDSIKSLKQEAEAYNFTDEQIQNYVKGLFTTSTKESKDDSVNLNAVNRPGDDGIGYEVKSESGYYQETAYATLPLVHRNPSNSAYMFYTVSVPGFGIDVGLWYGSGWDGEGWRGFHTADGEQVGGELITSLQAGSKVYFNAKVESNGYLRFRVLDGNDFSTVYYDLYYYVGDEGIYTTNAAFNRQITLTNDNKDFNNGSYVRNAKFSQAYIYSSNGYYQVSPSNTVANRVGAFGTNDINKQQVKVNSYSKWFEEDIDIDF